jgi:hypothetical protein
MRSLDYELLGRYLAVDLIESLLLIPLSAECLLITSICDAHHKGNRRAKSAQR